MRAEAAWLIALARSDESPPPGPASVDLERWLELARLHQMAPLAHWCCSAAGEPSPWRTALHEVFESLRVEYLHHMMRNESLRTDLADLFTALEEKGIEAVVFKGPWLAFEAYPDPGTRPVDDIDLGVRERDYTGTAEVLTQLGYRTQGALPSSPSEALERAHYRSQLRFAARGRRMVELHFRMINIGPPSAAEPWLWERARTISIGPAMIRTPGAEAMLLHLCLHANQHGFSVLRLLHDVRFALERIGRGLDLDAFLALVNDLRCSPAIYHSLRLSSELCGAPVPTDLARVLRPGFLRRRIFSAVWCLPHARRLEASRRRMETESPLLYLLEMGRLSDKARYVGGMMREAGGPLAFLRAARRLMPGPRGA